MNENIYELLTLEQAADMTINQLIEKYNDLLDSMLELQGLMDDLVRENDSILKDYNELFDLMYGIEEEEEPPED